MSRHFQAPIFSEQVELTGKVNTSSEWDSTRSVVANMSSLVNNRHGYMVQRAIYDILFRLT